MAALVSILIPAYNAEKFIGEAIESALAQSWPNKELIIVDDGSSDNTLNIAQSFASSKVKVISQENRGASAARNTALAAAQGDFIQYLDADDLLAPDKIDKQMQHARTGLHNFVIAGTWTRFYKHPEDAVFSNSTSRPEIEPVAWLVRTWSENSMMHPAAWLVPRQVAEIAGLWNEDLSLNDDGEYFCRVVLASREIKFCENAKSYYRSGLVNSLSGLKSAKAWASAFLALKLNTNNLLMRENSSRTRRACAITFQRLIYEVYPDVPHIREECAAKVKLLGGVKLQPAGGPKFQLLSRTLGWKTAKLLQNYFYRYDYKRICRGIGSRHINTR